MQWQVAMGRMDSGGRQWLGGSGTVGQMISMRFERCLFERVSVSVDRDTSVFPQPNTFQSNMAVVLHNKHKGCGSPSGSGYVAVVPIDRENQRGSNDADHNPPLAVLNKLSGGREWQ
jgi:hypothetical protein